MYESFFQDRPLLDVIEGQPNDWSVGGVYQWAFYLFPDIDWTVWEYGTRNRAGYVEWTHRIDFEPPENADLPGRGLATLRVMEGSSELWNWIGFLDPGSSELYMPWMTPEEFENTLLMQQTIPIAIERSEPVVETDQVAHVAHMMTVVLDEQPAGIEGLNVVDIIFASDADDEIAGFDGDDVIDAGDGNNRVTGGNGVDIIFAGDGADDLSGGRGDEHDYIDAGDGRNVIYGDLRRRAENDEFGGDDHMLGGGDRDEVWGGGGADVIRTGGSFDTVHGGQGDDLIETGTEADEIYGEGGHDFIDAGSGDDMVWGHSNRSPGEIDPGEPDEDTIDGGSGQDVIDAGHGDDHIDGGRGNDAIRAGSGDDHINGGLGTDEVYGGAGVDTFILRLEGTGPQSELRIMDYELDEWIQVLVPRGTEFAGKPKIDAGTDAAVFSWSVPGPDGTVAQGVVIDGFAQPTGGARAQQLTILDPYRDGRDIHLFAITDQESLPPVPDVLLAI